MQSMIQSELPLGNEWNEVNFSIESKTEEIEVIKEIYLGVYADNLQSSYENIQFLDPIRCIIDISLLKNIQGQEDLEELEEDMNLDLNSTKSADLIENPMQDRGIFFLLPRLFMLALIFLFFLQLVTLIHHRLISLYLYTHFWKN